MDDKRLADALARLQARIDDLTAAPAELLKGSERLRALMSQGASGGDVDIPAPFLHAILTNGPIAELAPGVADRIAELWNSPNGQGWIRLCELLRLAANDELVKGSRAASDFLDLVTVLAEDSVSAMDGDEPFRQLEGVFASDRASKRHERSGEARAWVIKEWKAHAASYGRNKSAFARDYARRVWNELQVKVTDRTIREDWLKAL